MPRSIDFDHAPVRRFLKTAQTIHGALAFGVLIFGGVAFFVGPSVSESRAMDDGTIRILVIAAGVATVMTALPAFVLANRLAASAIRDRSAPPEIRAQRYFTMRIICAALIEGPGLFWGVITLMSGDPIHLAGLGFCVFALLSIFPRAAEWEDAGYDLDRTLTGERTDELV